MTNTTTLGPSVNVPFTQYRYAEENVLQTYEVCIPEGEDGTATKENGKYWVIYIHGGAWRDPKITASSFRPIVPLLLSSDLSHKIAGYASLNYRLSAHDAYSQDPSMTPPYDMRDAKHPDHINDIITALASLQQKYKVQSRYLLAGHSCGATLAYEVAMSHTLPWMTSDGKELQPELTADPPVGILGVEGIYDIPVLIQSFTHIPIYRTFVRGAFGDDEQVWKEASPASWSSYSRSWTTEDFQSVSRRRVAVIAHSQEDEMVDWKQVDSMATRLRTEQDERLVFRVLTAQGHHDEVWKEKTELLKAITGALQLILETEKRDL